MERKCGTCFWHGKLKNEKGWICMNPYSRAFEKRTTYGANCIKHESREERGVGKNF